MNGTLTILYSERWIQITASQELIKAALKSILVLENELSDMNQKYQPNMLQIHFKLCLQIV